VTIFDLGVEDRSTNGKRQRVEIPGLETPKHRLSHLCAHPWASMLIVVVWKTTSSNKQGFVLLTADCLAIKLGEPRTVVQIGEPCSVEFEAGYGASPDTKNDWEDLHITLLHSSQKSVCISRCGGYLRLNAFWNSHVWNRIAEFPPLYCANRPQKNRTLAHPGDDTCASTSILLPNVGSRTGTHLQIPAHTSSWSRQVASLG
jgi:hypothetical protein